MAYDLIPLATLFKFSSFLKNSTLVWPTDRQLSYRDAGREVRIASVLAVTMTTYPLWARIVKNPDYSTGPLTHPFTCSLAPLTLSLAPHYSLCSRPILLSLTSLLAHSFICGTVNDWNAIKSVFFSILAHSATVKPNSNLFSFIQGMKTLFFFIQ